MISKLLMAVTYALAAIGAPGVTGDVFQAGNHYLNVGSDGLVTLWEEGNGVPGLQSAPVYVLGQAVVVPDRQVHF